jgi:hypothetical protein
MVESSWEHENAFSGFKEGGKFFDQLCDYVLNSQDEIYAVKLDEHARRCTNCETPPCPIYKITLMSKMYG